jgi:8-hydroxy-5-deazaflavin:NADPH oxidoreductase
MGSFGILGTGVVGQTLGSKLVGLGHDVMIGGRDAANPVAQEWAAQAGERARSGDFHDVAEFGATIFLATAGRGALAAVGAAGNALAGKLLIDVTVPLDFSAGFPPSLFVCGSDSLGEQLQRAAPAARVVKALNTVTASVMVDPASVPGEHHLFVAGEEVEAKRDVVELLATFGWPPDRVLDLGGIAAARATEAYVLFWVYLYAALGSPEFNIEVHRGAGG